MNEGNYKDIDFEVKEQNKKSKVLVKYSGKKQKKQIVIMIVAVLISIIGMVSYFILDSVVNTSNLGASQIIVDRKIDNKIKVVYDKQYNEKSDIKVEKSCYSDICENPVEYHREYTTNYNDNNFMFSITKFKKSIDINNYFDNKSEIVKTNENIQDYVINDASNGNEIYKIVSYYKLYEFGGAKFNEYYLYRKRKLYKLESKEYDSKYSEKIFIIFVKNN